MMKFGSTHLQIVLVQEKTFVKTIHLWLVPSNNNLKRGATFGIKAAGSSKVSDERALERAISGRARLALVRFFLYIRSGSG